MLKRETIDIYSLVGIDFVSDINRYNAFLPRTCKANEKAFHDCCNALDILLGNAKSNQSFNQIVSDKVRHVYIGIIEMLMRNTRLTIIELARELGRIANTVDNNSRRNKKSSCFRIDNITETLIKWLRYPSREPKWHMLKRGDTRELPNRDGCDLWGYLNMMYTDPEYCRVIPPDYVKKHGHKFIGYMEFVEKARREGQRELMRRYGPNIDLSMRPQKRTSDSIDETNRTIFMKDIRNGNMLPDIALESNARREAKRAAYEQQHARQVSK